MGWWESVMLTNAPVSGVDTFLGSICYLGVWKEGEVTDRVLAVHKDDKDFRKAVGIARGEVVAGTVRIVEDGAGTYHAIEPEYIRPEVHSLMKVNRPVVRARDLDRVVLLVK